MKIKEVAEKIESSKSIPLWIKNIFYRDIERYYTLKESLERNGFYLAAERLYDFSESTDD